LLRRQLPDASRAPAALALQHRDAALRVADGDVFRQSRPPAGHRAGAGTGGVVRVTFVTCGLEHLGIEALSAWVRRAGHEPALVYEARPFSSGSGTDSRLLARLLDPRPEETADRIAATRPEVVAFTSYSVTHRWAVAVARAVKQRCDAPIVFG